MSLILTAEQHSIVFYEHSTDPNVMVEHLLYICPVAV
ncbi:hypothetical protein T11_15398 [Trichinella zimbabwensis]|uniref:Uncharacterized protein n=1 Tax=Trichinella zimbabwensis TaxID=268475 RepID=A0A0V1F2Z1_9BILA|nr:hypothetical protein T11_15398 [Trichinella zimbabwensis]